MTLRPRLLTSIAAGIGASVTLGVSLINSIQFAYRAPELHVAFDTAEGLIALSAAYLVSGRLRERELFRDALLASALLLIGSANLLALVAPPLSAQGDSPDFAIWAALVIRLIGSGAIAAAAFAGTRPIPPGWARGRKIAIVSTLVLAGAFALAYVVSQTIALGLSPSISPVQGNPVIAGGVPLLGTQLILVALFALGAIGFSRAAEAQPDDPFLRWLGPGYALNAFARVNFFLFPSTYTDYIYVGDFLRLTFYLLLLVGASQEVRLYWRRLEQDIKERERLNVELEALSLTDPLTGLNNRRGFETLAEHAMAAGARASRPLALMYIDLNDMKAINDLHGHDMGDAALREVGAILLETFRDSDIVARLGGDEFCALLGAESGHVENAPERLQALVESSNRQDQRPYRLSLSIGMAQWDPAHPETLNVLMEKADASMYANKRGHSKKPPILLVEDNSSIQKLIRLSLGDDHEVLQASTAAQALTITRDRTPHLVILDYYLPDANGVDLIKRLRISLGTEVPVVVLTGASDVNEAAVLRAGADDYIEKPFDVDVLKARIERLLKTTSGRR